MEDLLSNEFFTGTIVPIVTSIALALVSLIVGKIIIKKIVHVVARNMEKRGTDATLRPFFVTMLNFGLQTILYVTVIGILGIETTSFAAILASAGLAIGMALSGTLQNFAGGVMILLFKPFKAGDVIEAQGYTGTVKEIQLFVTVLTTPDNKTIIIPNGPLSNGSMVNFSTQATRRVDWTFGIGYGDDVDKAREVINTLINADNRILKDPAALIAVSELADSSVNFTVRAWVNAADYWGVFFDMNENVYKTFDKEGLNIPFPQMDVHVHN